MHTHDASCACTHLSTTSAPVNTATEHAALSDYSPRDKSWDTHRSEAQNLQYIYAEAEEFERYAARISACSGVLRFAPIVNKDTGELALKLREAQFCRVRTCPVCQWRRSLMWLARFYQTLPEIQSKYMNARWLFLTLTVRNCDIHDLRETIKSMNEGWKRLTLRKEFKPVLGWIRTTEVTRGKDGSAHPHFHALLMVPPSYFGVNYIKQTKWTELWQESARLNYTPVVNIKAVKHGQLLEKAVAETLKYAVKPADITADAEWTLELTRQIHRLRFIASGGVLKDALKEDDESNEDLILADQPAEDADANTDARIAFSWRNAEKRYRRYPRADQ